MDLRSLFEGMEALWISETIRDSAALSSMFNLMHLLAIVVLVGAVLIVDLRLLGRGMSQQPVAQVASDARPWLIGALVALLVTGLPQLTSTAMKQYFSPNFWWKMELLAVTLVFTFAIRERIAHADESRVSPAVRALVGVVSIALWTAIAINGRLIGLLG
jgi:hypothetical protein